jgi:UDP-N-acetylmuramoyl-tripeptide--D-alanyl-D-alanine ligase
MVVTAVSVSDLVAAAHNGLDLADFPTDLDLSGAELVHGSRGVLIIDDTHGATADSTAAALKMLVQIAGPHRRSVAILGELDGVDADKNDDHDAIGRLAVRLNVQKLIVVGHPARHIHNAAGLEGSWDGESRLVGTAQEAYDLLREDVREGDVVLVKSSRATGLDLLAKRLAEVAE